MGCCNTADRSPARLVLLRYLRAIENKSFAVFEELLKKLAALKNSGNIINEKIGEFQGLSLNSLGYALYVGQTEMFIYIHRVHKAKVIDMENLLNSSKSTSLYVIFEKNYLEIFKYFLPIYIEEIKEDPIIVDFNSVLQKEFDGAENSEIQYFPVHLATFQENIGILAYVKSYFEGKSYVPRLLDMEYKEETTGENCVLIACRMGSYKMIKFLHTTCKLSFRVKNSLGHNAINVLIDGNNGKLNLNALNYSLSILSCLKYLVEIAGVDIEHMYKFSLIRAKEPPVIKYIEEKLREIGIQTSKHEIEVLRLQSCENRFSKLQFSDIKNSQELFFSELKFRSSTSIEFQ